MGRSRLWRRIAVCLVAAIGIAGAVVAAPAALASRLVARVSVSDVAATQRAADAAATTVSSRPSYLHAGPDDAFVQVGVTSSSGLEYVAYERTYRGLPVVGGDFVLVADRAGNITSASVAQKHAITGLATTPKLTQEAAENVVSGRLTSVSKIEGSRLVVYALGGSAPRLAWESTVDGMGTNRESVLTVYVDALTGTVLDTREGLLHGTGTSFFNGPNPVPVATTFANGVYMMMDPIIKSLRCQDYDTGKIFSKTFDMWGNGDPTSRETGCVDAMFAAQTEAKMLWQWLGRNGMDGNGGAWPIRMGSPSIGAFYNGSSVTIGHDFDTPGKLMSQIDVVGHEFGHGIDDHTPGGISRKNTAEFVADAFGAATEWFAKEPAPYDTPDFNTADNLTISRRYMSFSSQWSTYPCYSSSVDTVPDDETHSTAGPGDHWFYLLAEGTNPTDGQPVSQTCNGTTMTGVGIHVAISVLYNAMLMKTSDSSYPAYRAWTLAAARNYYPGRCDIFNRVRAAWDAVSVPAGPGEPDDCRPIAYGWGLNNANQVGDLARQPGVDGVGQPAPAPVFGLATGVTQVAGGDAFSVALHTDGTVWTWGDNHFGQLGDGSTAASRATPGQVPGLTGIKQVSAHGAFALAVGADGSLWTWGDNTYGQLGTGGNLASGDGMRRTPFRVPGLIAVAQAAAGTNFTTTVRTNGEVWAWGANDYGQLGDRTTTPRLTPVRSTAPYGIVGVAAGRLHAMALRNDGSVWAWGYNAHGELGDGTTVGYNSTAVRVDQHVAGATQIAAGEFHSMALGADGTMWTWGENSYGELGDGTTTSRSLAVHLSLSGITQIDAGFDDSLAVRSDGTLWMWGYNGDGQLGDFMSEGYLTFPRPVQGLSDVAQASADWMTVHAIAVPHGVIVPDLTDETLAEAAATLQELGLTVAQPVQYTTDFQCNYINTVINHSPTAGTLVFMRSAIHIVIGTLPTTPCP